MSKCTLPPEGWKCTREAGHEWPCAAVPASPQPPHPDTVRKLDELRNDRDRWEVAACANLANLTATEAKLDVAKEALKEIAPGPHGTTIDITDAFKLSGYEQCAARALSRISSLTDAP